MNWRMKLVQLPAASADIIRPKSELPKVVQDASACPTFRADIIRPRLTDFCKQLKIGAHIGLCRRISCRPPVVTNFNMQSGCLRISCFAGGGYSFKCAFFRSLFHAGCLCQHWNHAERKAKVVESIILPHRRNGSTACLCFPPGPGGRGRRGSRCPAGVRYSGKCKNRPGIP